MTDTQKLKRLYMLLRWYDSYVKSIDYETPDDDLRLALELEKEMHAIQAEALRVKKKKNKCTSQAKTSRTKRK